MRPKATQSQDQCNSEAESVCLIAYMYGGKGVCMVAKPLFHQQLERSPCGLFEGLPRSHSEKENNEEMWPSPG